MTDKEKNNDNYELPTGIVLPEDNSTDYPNWKKGIVPGIICGIILGIILAVTPLSEEIGGKIAYGALGFVMGFLLAGATVAFRPQKN
jgi:hypothetical protein